MTLAWIGSFIVIPALKAQTPTQVQDTLVARSTSEVTVTSTKPFVQQLVDRTILNLSARPSSAGQNALELLRSAPGVVVDPQENLRMGGKNGVNVMVDNRPTDLGGQDLAQFLKSIEADNIQTIEIITNPAARYDAAGNAGIINIRLKKSLTHGFNGNLSGSLTQSTHARASGAASFNLRQGKWNVFGNGGANAGFQVTTANNDRQMGRETLTQRGTEDDRFHGGNFRTGVDVQVSPKTTVGLLWNHNERVTQMRNNNLAEQSLPGQSDRFTRTLSQADFSTQRNNVNANLKTKWGKNSELSADLDYTRFGSQLYNPIETQQWTKGGVGPQPKEWLNDAGVQIGLKSIKIDFVQNRANGFSWEAGWKSVFAQTESNILAGPGANKTFVPDTGRSNQFNLNESIQAAYISAKGKWGKFQIQGGLRAEYSRILGRSIDLKQAGLNKPDTAYLNVFPSFFLQYNPAQHHQFGLSLSRRIDRPNYQDQNPFVYVLDAFNLEQGNPYLVPQFTQSLELSYTYKYTQTIKISYAQTTGFIEQMTYRSGEQTIQTPQNAGTRKVLSIGLSSFLPLLPWWELYTSAEPFYQSFDIQFQSSALSQNIQNGSWGFNGYMSHTLNLGKGWKADLSGWFNYQNATTLYVSQPLGSLNLGASKKIWKDKATVKLSISDLFNTQRWQQRATTPELVQDTYRKWESRNISIGFSYRFGNRKIKDARERSSGQDSELGRIK